MVSGLNTEFFSQPEQQILLYSVTNKHFNETAIIRERLRQVTDWDYLLNAALQHAVFPSFYLKVVKSYLEMVPPKFLDKARSLYLTLGQRNMRITSELLGLLEALESQEIPVIPFRGPTLAALAYGDVTLRQFMDLDILVHPQDISKVKDFLQSFGYRLAYRLTEKQERIHLHRTCEFTFIHSHRTMLDIHWRFAADYMGTSLNPESMFARAVLINLQGKRVYSLALDDLLLVLCAHGVFHGWSNLAMVTDVARLVEAQETWDWAGLVRQAGKLGMRRSLALGLSLASELLAAPVPEGILEEAERDPAIPALRSQAKKNLFADPRGSLVLAASWFHLRTKERLKDKLDYLRIRALIPTVEDWQWVYLPDRLYWVYFLLRPLRIASQLLQRDFSKFVGLFYPVR
jgi:hypothetical protein